MPSRSPLDLLLAFVGCFLLTFAPVSVVSAYVFPPDAGTALVTVGVTAVVSAPLAVWYWWSSRSVGDLGTFVFTVTALSTVLGFVVLSLLRVRPRAGGSAAGGAFVFLGVVYVVAYYAVYGGGWDRLRAIVRSSSLVDLLLAFVGCFLLAFAPVSVVSAYVFPPDAVTTLIDFGVTALVAVPLAVRYWKSGRSLGDLGTFFFWVMALTLVFGASAFGILTATGPVETGSVADMVVTSTLLLAVYAGAYHMVYRDGWAHLRAALESR